MQIPARFNGPPGSGNGGWSAGAFALAVGPGPREVTLRRPPPLDTPLTAEGSAFHAPGGELVAEVGPVAEAIEAVPFASVEAAAEVSAGYPGFAEHPFPTCYVCGTERPDGLRIFPGRLPDGRTAAPWVVPGDVGEETMWAALDCPGGWSALRTGRLFVLGRIAVAIDAMPAPGASCVVVGRAEAMSGRKAITGSTVYAADGTRLAAARATWIEIASVP